MALHMCTVEAMIVHDIVHVLIEYHFVHTYPQGTKYSCVAEEGMFCVT